MRVTILADRLTRHPWSRSWTVIETARFLAARGHRVRVVCDSCDEPRVMEGCELSARRPFRSARVVSAGGLARFFRAASNGPAADGIVLSFTRVAPGDVWMPLGRGAGPEARWLLRTLLTSGHPRLDYAVRRLLPLYGAARRERRVEAELERARALVAAGPAAADRARAALPGLASRVVDLGHASGIEPPSAEVSASWRARVRRALRLDDARVVGVMALASSADRGHLALLDGLGRVGERWPERAPVVMIAARDAHGVHAAARRARAGHLTRIVGVTARMDALLAAADIGVSPSADGPGRLGLGSTGRFAADCLRMGRPLLIASGAPGADLVGGAANPESAPGLVLERSDAERWTEALATACDATWRARATGAARRLAPALGLRASASEAGGAADARGAGGWLERMEALLMRVRDDRDAGIAAGASGQQSARP